MKTVINIPEQDLVALNRLGQSENVSQEELVLRAISMYVGSYRKAEVLKGFGLWKDNPQDGMKLQTNLRAEWDR